jgi:hypothetical protein
MLAVHWSPVKNTRRILKNGIRKAGQGVHCFPLTGVPGLDRYWRRLFRAGRPLEYNGFVFRLTHDDFPAFFGHYACGATYLTLPELTSAFRETIIYRLCERYAGLGHGDVGLGFGDLSTCSLTAAEEKALISPVFKNLTEADPGLYNRTMASNPGYLRFIFEDFQIVLPHAIAPERIIKVIPGGGRSGRQIRKKRQHAGVQEGSGD